MAMVKRDNSSTRNSFNADVSFFRFFFVCRLPLS